MYLIFEKGSDEPGILMYHEPVGYDNYEIIEYDLEMRDGYDYSIFKRDGEIVVEETPNQNTVFRNEIDAISNMVDMLLQISLGGK